MLKRSNVWLAIALMTVIFGSRGFSTSGAKDMNGEVGIPPDIVADYVHSVIQADRTIYTTHVVERMQVKGIVGASENWEQRNALPLPAQFLIEASRLVAQRKNGIRYRLMSLWPINERNKPVTDLERDGLEDVLTTYERPYTGIVTIGRTRYFQAIYADRAVSPSCVGCHNAHPHSPKRDFKLNEVMGGIVITIPLAH